MEKKEEDDFNPLTVLRQIDPMFLQKEKRKIRINGEDLACLKGPAVSAEHEMMTKKGNESKI